MISNNTNYAFLVNGIFSVYEGSNTYYNVGSVEIANVATNTSLTIDSRSITFSNTDYIFSLTAPNLAEASDGGYFLNANGQWSPISNVVIHYTANNALYLGGLAANAYLTIAGLPSNALSLSVNSAAYVGNLIASNVVSNAQLQANLANYTNTSTLITTLANYELRSSLAGDVLTLTSNNTNYVGTVTAANVVSNAQLQANLTNYVTNATFVANLTTINSEIVANAATSYSNATYFIANGTGAVGRTILAKAREIVSLADFGAAGNGSVDDSAHITYALNQVSSYGGGAIQVDDIYYVNTAITIPPYVTLLGSRNNFSVNKTNYQYATNKPVIILGSGGSITMQGGSKIDGITILQANCVSAPTSNAMAQAVVNGFSGTAITIAGDECTVENSLIIGFNKAIYMDGTSYLPYGLQRLRVDNIGIDCTNGIEITQSYDTNRITRVHLWNYYNGNNPAVTDINTAFRAGKGIYIHDHCDGTVVSNVLDFGHQYAYWIDGGSDNIFALQIVDCLSDGGFSNSTITSYGLYTNGYIAGSIFNNISVESHTYNYYFNHTGVNSTILGGALKSGASGNGNISHYRFGANSSGAISTAGVQGAALSTVSAYQWDSGVSKWDIGVAVENTGAMPYVHHIANSDLYAVTVHSKVLHNCGAYDPIGVRPTDSFQLLDGSIWIGNTSTNSIYMAYANTLWGQSWNSNGVVSINSYELDIRSPYSGFSGQLLIMPSGVSNTFGAVLDLFSTDYRTNNTNYTFLTLRTNNSSNTHEIFLVLRLNYFLLYLVITLAIVCFSMLI